MNQHSLEVATQKLVLAVTDIHEALKVEHTEKDIPMLTQCAKSLRLATPQMEGMAETCDGLVRMIRRRV